MAERRNLVVKPNFSSAAPKWIAKSGTEVVSFVSENAKAGKAAKVVTNATSTFEGALTESSSIFVPSIEAGKKYTFSCWIYIPVGSAAIGKSMAANLVRIGAGGNDQVPAITLASGFNRLSGTFTAAVGTTALECEIFFASSAGKIAVTFYISALLVEYAEVVNEYFDGSNANAGWTASWLGATNESISKETNETGVVKVKSGGSFVAAVRKVRGGGGLTLIHEDPMVSTNVETDWGLYQAAALARYGLVTGGGDPWTRKGNGEERANFNYRTLELKSADVANVGNERTELGANESRNGIAGGSGTFMLYKEGHRYQTWFSMWLPSNFPISTPDWYLVMQMKQTQPYSSSEPSSSPIIEMNVRSGKWLVVLEPATGTYTWNVVPVTAERWTRFCFDIYYAKSAAEGGFLRILVDDRASPTEGLFVPQYDSGIWSRATIAKAVGAQTQGSPPVTYADQQAIPGHLRLGQYRNTVHNVDTISRLSNIQVYEVLGEGSSWTEA